MIADCHILFTYTPTDRCYYTETKIDPGDLGKVSHTLDNLPDNLNAGDTICFLEKDGLGAEFVAKVSSKCWSYKRQKWLIELSADGDCALFLHKNNNWKLFGVDDVLIE